MAEVVVVLKNKICSKDVKVVLMTLCLVEAMVKNGTPLVHASIGTDFFMKEMANTARKYNAKIGQDNREVVDQCLNMIQCWGEGFAASGSQNYFSKYYQDLRREGLPFNQNFDRSQLTDFSPPAGSTNAGPSAAQEMEDEILAAALAASLNSENVQSRPQSERTGAYGSSAAAPYRDYPAQSAHVVGNVVSVSSSGSSSGASFVELVSSATSSCALLRDMINASSSVAELRSNDIAEEVAGQIRGYQSQIMSSVELALTSYPEVSLCLPSLFSPCKNSNEMIFANSTYICHNKIRSCRLWKGCSSQRRNVALCCHCMMRSGREGPHTCQRESCLSPDMEWNLPLHTLLFTLRQHHQHPLRRHQHHY